jgi:hypothetical protein
MSALVRPPVNIDYSAEPEKEETTLKDSAQSSVLSELPLEAVYQLCFAPDPTPEQVAKEWFLLDCD